VTAIGGPAGQRIPLSQEIEPFWTLHISGWMPMPLLQAHLPMQAHVGVPPQMLPAPVPGPELGGVLSGGETGVGAGQQLHAQGGHASPETQAGHAQPQPPPPPPGTGFICTQRPLGGHGSVKHAMPSSTHPQVSAVSAAHDVGSVCAAQESAAGGVECINNACETGPISCGCLSSCSGNCTISGSVQTGFQVTCNTCPSNQCA